jgi:hypothetical protein
MVFVHYDPATREWKGPIVEAPFKATERGKYIEAFFRNIDWRMVERRLREEAAVRPAA